MAVPAMDLDPEWTDVERAAWETAHRFAKDVLRPAGEKLDKLPAGDVIARDSILWDVFKKYASSASESSKRIPISRRMTRPPSAASSARSWAGATPGSRSAWASANFPTMMAQMSGNPALIERFPAGHAGLLGDHRAGSRLRHDQFRRHASIIPPAIRADPIAWPAATATSSSSPDRNRPGSPTAPSPKPRPCSARSTWATDGRPVASLWCR